MSKTFLLWLFATGLLLGTAQLSFAQYNTTQANTTTAAPQLEGGTVTAANEASNAVVLSGCLERGATAEEYALFGQTANSWELRSDSVDLYAHLRQIVTVTGVPSPTYPNTLVVTGVSMVSESCSSE